ncbi:hypothetical protein D3C78_1019060 [compost metagenome]
MPGRTHVAAGAEVDVGEVEAAVVGGDGQVAGQRQAHAGAGHRAVQAGQQRSIQAAQQLQGLVHRLDQGFRYRSGVVAELGDVAAGHEAAAVAAEDDDAHLGVVGQLPAGCQEGAGEALVDGIEGLRPVEADMANRAVAFEQDRGSGHGLVLVNGDLGLVVSVGSRD